MPNAILIKTSKAPEVIAIYAVSCNITSIDFEYITHVSKYVFVSMIWDIVISYVLYTIIEKPVHSRPP